MSKCITAFRPYEWANQDPDRQRLAAISKQAAGASAPSPAAEEKRLGRGSAKHLVPIAIATFGPALHRWAILGLNVILVDRSSVSMAEGSAILGLKGMTSGAVRRSSVF